MSFGSRLITIRKERKISQGELAEKVGIHANVLGRYEREEATPSVDVAVKLAEALGVSLDYLTGKTDMELDKGMVEKIISIQKLPEDDRKHILFTLEALLRDAKIRRAYL